LSGKDTKIIRPEKEGQAFLYERFLIRKDFQMKRLVLAIFTVALVFVPAMLFAQMGREPAYNIIITPITYDPALEEDAPSIYESVVNEFGWQGQVNSLYRLIETTGQVGTPPSLSNLPQAAQDANPRYVLTVNLYIDGSDRVIAFGLYETATFTDIGGQELAYGTVAEALGLLAFFCWNLSSTLPPDDRPIDPEIIYVSPEEDITWKNKWLYLGLQGGISFRLYRSEKDSYTSIFTAGTTFDAGLRLEFQFVHFMVKSNYFSFSLESGTDISQEKLDWRDYTPTGDQVIPLDISGEGSTGLSLSFPALLKFNYKPGIFATTLYGGAYYILPLDDSEYSSPLGIAAGFSAGVKLGPGALYVDVHYGYDLGPKEFHYDATSSGSSDVPLTRDIIYRRQAFTLVVGYKFGFFGRPDWRKRQAEKKKAAAETESTTSP
jgi:hypothetical protein